MLAFIDSPIQIAVVMVVILLVFGPEKMKDIGKQLGRAIREVRRAGSDFRSTLEGEDNRYDSDYKPPHYDSYGNSIDTPTDYSSHYNLPSVSEEDVQPAITAGPQTPEPEHRGDFAAAALGDTSEYPIDYSAAPVRPQAASGPVYGVLTTPEQSVPREKTGVKESE
jgi:sec-independent protein translocase protein TatA